MLKKFAPSCSALSARSDKLYPRLRVFFFSFAKVCCCPLINLEKNFRSDLAASFQKLKKPKQKTLWFFWNTSWKSERTLKIIYKKSPLGFQVLKKQQPKILRKIFKTQSELREVFEKYFQKFAEWFFKIEKTHSENLKHTKKVGYKTNGKEVISRSKSGSVQRGCNAPLASYHFLAATRR